MLLAIVMVMVLTGMMAVRAEPLCALRLRAPLFIQEILALTKSSVPLHVADVKYLTSFKV